MTTSNAELRNWIEETAQLTKPDRIHWCDGSEPENDDLIREMTSGGTLIKLNEQTYPGCHLHRSDPMDVARTEHLTYICTSNREDAGPNNNWMRPEEGHKQVNTLFEGSMAGRTMYVVPYVMGPVDSPHARYGVEITDSPYVVANMRIMTRMGAVALEKIEASGEFVRGLHSLGDLSPERRFIMHFPEEMMIKSIGSGYGGNALLGKKCHALRLASWQARQEGWLAEHMLIMGVETPSGEVFYLAAAFPSACGKTNLAMLVPPDSFDGYRVWTVGEDIAWMHVGDDGRLWAINPEAGMFGVAPGTSQDTNANAAATIQRNTIFTNVALTEDGNPWWEGLSETPPENLTDWQGRKWDSSNGPAAHPNSRFTVTARQLPSWSEKMEEPAGVPISAMLFGGRRASLAPLVYQSFDWSHGVFVGASAASETTAASTGQVGVVRRDPMAMLPFCGYNMGDYWSHWLEMEKKASNLPKIFHVNWFRQNSAGKYLWPGFGENIRVLQWIIERTQGKGEAVRSPIGYLPTLGAIDTRLLDLTEETMQSLLTIDNKEWVEEMDGIEAYFDEFGARLPAAMREHVQHIREELSQV